MVVRQEAAGQKSWEPCDELRVARRWPGQTLLGLQVILWYASSRLCQALHDNHGHTQSRGGPLHFSTSYFQSDTKKIFVIAIDSTTSQVVPMRAIQASSKCLPKNSLVGTIFNHGLWSVFDHSNNNWLEPMIITLLLSGIPTLNDHVGEHSTNYPGPI